MLPEPYDPQWLVALATARHADKPWLAEALPHFQTGGYEKPAASSGSARRSIDRRAPGSSPTKPRPSGSPLPYCARSAPTRTFNGVIPNRRQGKPPAYFRITLPAHIGSRGGWNPGSHRRGKRGRLATIRPGARSKSVSAGFRPPYRQASDSLSNEGCPYVAAALRARRFGRIVASARSWVWPESTISSRSGRSVMIPRRHAPTAWQLKNGR